MGLSRVGEGASVQGIVGKQRRTRKSGNTDGKAIIPLSKHRRGSFPDQMLLEDFPNQSAQRIDAFCVEILYLGNGLEMTRHSSKCL